MQSVLQPRHAVQLTTAAALGFAAGVAIQAPLPEKEKPAPVLTRGNLLPISEADAEAISLFLASPGILM